MAAVDTVAKGPAEDAPTVADAPERAAGTVDSTLSGSGAFFFFDVFDAGVFAAGVFGATTVAPWLVPAGSSSEPEEESSCSWVGFPTRSAPPGAGVAGGCFSAEAGAAVALGGAAGSAGVALLPFFPLVFLAAVIFAKRKHANHKWRFRFGASRTP